MIQTSSHHQPLIPIYIYYHNWLLRDHTPGERQTLQMKKVATTSYILFIFHKPLAVDILNL
jgi:hypothetical protein